MDTETWEVVIEAHHFTHEHKRKRRWSCSKEETSLFYKMGHATEFSDTPEKNVLQFVSIVCVWTFPVSITLSGPVLISI